MLFESELKKLKLMEKPHCIFNKMHSERAKHSTLCDQPHKCYIKYFIINHLLVVFEALLEDIKIKPNKLINF